MGYQSSRIIWGKRNVNPEDFSPITIYDENYTIYQKGNYALYAWNNGPMKMYKCMAPETGGIVFPNPYENSIWEEVKGVKEFTTTKQYKVGARCIYGNYVYTCIQPVIYTNYDPIIRVPDQYPDYWELAKQDIELGYEPMDHKAVYYDDGRNKNKWHKLMFFIPDFYEDQLNLSLPITLYCSDYRYPDGSGPENDEHWDVEDRIYEVLYIKDSEIIRPLDNNPDTFKVYKYKRNEPYGGDWKPSYWDEETEIEYFEPGRTYWKGEKCIFNQKTYELVPVTTFNMSKDYGTGQYVLDYIKRSESLQYETVFAAQPEYIERIKGGEKIMGCYKILQRINAGDYTTLPHDGIITQLMPYYQVDELPDPNGSSGHGTGGDMPSVIIDSTVSHVICTPAEEKQFALYALEWTVTPGPGHRIVLEMTDKNSGYFVFKCIKEHTLQDFYRPYWEQVYTKIDGNIDLYGVIWKLLGQPGGGGYPFFSPIVMVNLLGGYKCQIDNFYYFPGNNYMEVGKRFSMNWTGVEIGNDVYYTGGFGAMILTNGIQMFCFTIGITYQKRYLHDDILMCAFGEWGTAKLPNNKVFPEERIIVSPSGFMFLDAESNTKEFYRANCSMTGPGIISISKIFEETPEPQHPNTNDEYYYIYGVEPIYHTVNGYILDVTKVRYYLSRDPLGTIEKYYSHYAIDENGNYIQITSESEEDGVYYSYSFYKPGLYYDSIDEAKLNVVIGETLYMQRDETEDPITTQQRANLNLHCARYNYRYTEEQVWVPYDFSYHTYLYVYRPLYKYESHTTATLARFSNLSGTKYYWFQTRTYYKSEANETIFVLATVSNGSYSATEVTGVTITGPVGQGSQGLIWANDNIAYIFLVGDSEGDDSMRGLYKLTLTGAPTLTKVYNYTRPGFQYPYSYGDNSNYIKYYNNQTVKIKINSDYAYINKIILHHKSEFKFARFVPRFSEPGVYTDTADVYLDFGLFIHCPYCSEGTANPSNMPNGLFASMFCRMNMDGQADWCSIGLCLPGFPSDSSFANAFFWLSGTAVQGSSYYTWDIDPAYGGPEEGGFWQGEERMLEHTGGQGSSGSSSSNEGGSGSSESNN